MRVLTVQDGFTSDSAPTGGSIGFGSAGVYASTAAFVSAKGSAAANGDVFINSSDNMLYHYVGSAWRTSILPDSTNVLTNKDFDGGTASDTSRITIPKAAKATLDGLTRKEGTLVYASDEETFYYDDGTDLRQLGTGSGGTGLNFISNNDFDVNIDGVSAYADSDQDTPVDGTGGSPTLAVSQTTSSPLRGDASLLLTKTAADLRGEGFGINFSIARGYRNTRLKVQFLYEVKSGTYVGGESSDLRVFVYDVTNAALIRLSNEVIIGQSGVFKATFDATSSESYRLIVHLATESTDAFTVAFDDMEVGPNDAFLTAAVSDSQSISAQLTCSWTSNVALTGVSYRIGDKKGYNIRVTASGGAPSPSTTLTVTLPDSVDYTKRTGSASDEPVVGQCFLKDSGSTDWVGTVHLISATTVECRWFDSTQATASSADTDVTPSSPFTFGDADFVDIVIHPQPITGLKSNLIAANNRTFRLAESYTMTRVTGSAPTRLGQYRSYLRGAGSSSTYTETNGAPTDTPTVANGFRIYSGNGFANADTNNEPSRYELFIGKNKSYQIQAYNTTGRTGLCSIDAIVVSNTVQNGLKVMYDPTTGILSLDQSPNASAVTTQQAGLNLGTVVTDPYFDIVVSDAPGVAFGLDGAVFAKYTTATAQTISGTTVVDFTTKVLDSHSAVTTGASWVFTAPLHGIYRVSASVRFQAATNAAVGDIFYMIVNNTTILDSFTQPVAADDPIGLSGSTLIQRNAGETISVSLFENTTPAVALIANALYNSISIERIGAGV